LSNGETVFETGDPMDDLTGWQQLIDRCRSENLRITQLQLQRNGVTIVSVPNAEVYLQAYEARSSGRNTTKTTLMQGVGVVVNDMVHITWIAVDERLVKQDVRPLSLMYLHTNYRQFMEQV
jgi:hypothetical protein